MASNRTRSTASSGTAISSILGPSSGSPSAGGGGCTGSSSVTVKACVLLPVSIDEMVEARFAVSSLIACEAVDPRSGPSLQPLPMAPPYDPSLWPLPIAPL